jgi:hypothetical protein
MRKHAHLWNDLPDDERKRLHPYAIESQIVHLEQAKAKVIRGHQRTLDDFNSHIKNLKETLRQMEVLSERVKEKE